MILNFEFEKETKNTIRFAEVDEGDGLKVGTLYLQKSALKSLGYQNGDIIQVSLKAIQE
jgi:hypothetical protein